MFEKRDRLHMENLYGDDIERCPFLRNLWFCTDVMFSLNGRDMDKQGGQKKSRGPTKATPRVQIMLMLRITVLLQGGSVGFTRATQKPIK